MTRDLDALGQPNTQTNVMKTSRACLFSPYALAPRSALRATPDAGTPAWLR